MLYFDRGRAAQFDSFFVHERVGAMGGTEVNALIDGLWLLRRAAIRRLFRLRIFIECPVRTRLRRRLTRDLRSRGPHARGVEAQFWKRVEAMHRKFVLPQRRWADVILKGKWDARQIENLAARLRAFNPEQEKTARQYRHLA